MEPLFQSVSQMSGRHRAGIHDTTSTMYKGNTVINSTGQESLFPVGEWPVFHIGITRGPCSVSSKRRLRIEA